MMRSKLFAIAALGLAALAALGAPSPVRGSNAAGADSPSATLDSEEVDSDSESGVLQIFWDAWLIANQHYLDRSALTPERLLGGALVGLVRTAQAEGDPAGLSLRSLVQGAIRGMIRNLGDPNSVYLTPEERRVVITGFSGHLEGIGACLELRDQQLAVVGTVDGSPAERAGLRPGDRILAIDGRPTEGGQLQDLALAVRGPKGSPVVLTIHRAESEAGDQRAIEREEIQLVSARGRLLDPGIGQLRIEAFTERTEAEVGAVLEALEQQGVRALVLDLRGNLGGLLQPAVAVASRLTSSSPIVQQENGHGERYDYDRPPDQPAVGWPLIVLVDGWTASASEVVAMALRDGEGALLVGRPTYGKGTVQYLFELRDGSGLHITAARWISPAGHELERGGLTPDVWTAAQPSPEDDPTLAEAVLLLRAALGPTDAAPARYLPIEGDDCSPNNPNAA